MHNHADDLENDDTECPVCREVTPDPEHHACQRPQGAKP